jgi:hypothetical protein
MTPRPKTFVSWPLIVFRRSAEATGHSHYLHATRKAISNNTRAISCQPESIIVQLAMHKKGDRPTLPIRVASTLDTPVSIFLSSLCRLGIGSDFICANTISSASSEWACLNGISMWTYSAAFKTRILHKSCFRKPGIGRHVSNYINIKFMHC